MYSPLMQHPAFLCPVCSPTPLLSAGEQLAWRTALITCACAVSHSFQSHYCPVSVMCFTILNVNPIIALCL